MDIIKAIEREQMKNKIPKLSVGNTVRVHQRITEGKKTRIQVLEGTFTVRRVSYGVGVEKTFLVHSPNVEKVELVRVGKARRAKLNYLRDRVGKKAKTKEVVGARIVNEEVVLIPETEEVNVEEVLVKEEVTENPEVVEATEEKGDK